MSPALLIAAINAGIMLIELATKIIATGKKGGEYNKAEEAELDAKIADLSNKPWWKEPGS